MCFSAGASFTAGTLLSGMGIVNISVLTTNKRHIPLAIAPLLFGVQQLLEGILWVTLQHNSFGLLHTIALYGFLFFAFIVWPIFIPTATFFVEKNNTRKKIVLGLLLLGICIATLFLYYGLRTPLSVAIDKHHLVYNLNLTTINSALITFLSGAYLLCSCGSLLICSAPSIWGLGLLFLISYVISFIFYNVALVSVWCFFSAVISCYIFGLLLFHRLSKRGRIH